MNRNLSLGLGLLAFALTPVLAQTAAPTVPTGPTGKIHGHVTNPTGVSTTNGSVSLSNDGGHTSKFTFPVNASGDYTGVATPGTYTVVYRAPETPADKMVDSIDNVKVILNQDVMQDIDMSRAAFIDKLSPEQKKQLEDIKKHNSEALKANEVIKNLNADLRTVTQDVKDADSARDTAKSQLPATATKAEIDAKEAEIRATKYGEIESLMLKDTAAKPDASVLWAQLGQAQIGLKKYDEAIESYKKALDLETASKKPNLNIQGSAYSGMGEVYARTGKADDALTAYDSAAKINPSQASFYLRNEAVIFYQVGNADAQVTASDKAITVDPTQPLVYYLKGNGLVQKTTMDDKTHKLVAPAGCLEAYQKYLELSPTGPYATEVKGILAGFDQKIDTSYKAPKAGKK
jgi:tetratricopeptide (TPR) repeat protein